MSDDVLYDMAELIKKYRNKKAPRGTYYTFYFRGGYVDCKSFQSNLALDKYIDLEDSKGHCVSSILSSKIIDIYLTSKKHIGPCLYRSKL